MKRFLIPLVFVCICTSSIAGATYTVTTTNDSGPGSLPQAVADANASSTDDMIMFNISGCPNGVCTISLSSRLIVNPQSSGGKLTISTPSGPNDLVISGVNGVFDTLSSSDLYIAGLTIKNAWGAIHNRGSLTIENSIIRNNQRYYVGGGIYNDGGSLTVIRSQISENIAQVDIKANSGSAGGAIYSFNGYVSIRESSIVGNSAIDGGGVFSVGDNMSIVNSTIAHNGACRGGGLLLASPASIVNSTLSGNRVNFNWCSGEGGAILTTNIAPIPTFINVTVTGNEAFYGGGVASLLIEGGAMRARNSIFSGNIATNYPDISTDTILVQNLGNNIISQPALLGPLQNNGGPTMTHALLPGSPAINAGDNCVLIENGCGFAHPALTTDQRGLPREDTVDIGAFERQSIDVSPVAPFDYDGDRKSDFSVWRPSDGFWHLVLSGSGGYRPQPWGLPGDKVVPADYDGDGTTDMAVYRPNDNGSGLGRWYVINSSNFSFNDFKFGVNGDVPLPQDYDGDGRADLCVFRPADSTWYMIKSTNNLFYVYPFGVTGDKPVPADYTGDGRAEIAVWRPADGSWHTVDLTNGAYSTFNWGVTGDVPVPGDYSGDGRADYAVYRPANNTWYRMNSNDFFMYDTRWGVANDIPTPGDYDGDGRIDLAIFRPAEGRWYVLTQSYAFMTQQFGITGDIPTESAYVYGLPGQPF
jgi:hypothetical protein